MPSTIANLFSPITAALALLAGIVLAPSAEAQGGRQLPSPVSSAQLEAMLRDSGLPDTVKDAAPQVHEAYFARFREFEKREIDPIISKPSESPFDLARSVDDAKKESDLRRRAFQRAAELDGQMVDELMAVLPSDDAWRANKLRQALSRRRCSALAPAFGSFGRPLEFSLRSAPVIRTLEPDTQRMVNLGLDVYENELTRQLERYANASFARVVKAAEAREQLGVKSAPETPEGGDGQQAPAPAGEEWFRKMREAQKLANADCAAIIARIRKLHREGLDQAMPLMPPVDARLLRDHMIAAIYPSLRPKSGFDGVFDTARSMHAKGELDEDKWRSAQQIADANELTTRPIVLELMDLIDKRAAASEVDAIMFDEGGDEQSKDRMKRLRDDLAKVEMSNATTLRAALGIPEPEQVQGADANGRGINGVNLAEILGGGGGAVTMQAVMIGGDGEAITISSDDLGEGGISFGGLTDMMRRTPRAMNRDELEQLAERLGFAGDTRATFDEIVARCAEARIAAEKEHRSAPKLQTEDESGTVTFTIGLAGEDAVDDGGAGEEALEKAIDGAEERMFDELKAAAAADREAAVEAARRARARLRLLPGENGPQAVDLLAVAAAASLDSPSRDHIAGTLAAWDEASVGTIRAMRTKVKALTDERERIFSESMREVKQDDGNGQVSTQRSLEISGDTADRLQDIEKRIASTRKSVADANKRALDTMIGELDGNEKAQLALRRSFLRASNPAIYRTARDLEPFFTKAAAVEGVGPQGRKVFSSIRDEWIDAREARCQEFVELAEKEEAKQSSDGIVGDVQNLQLRMRERKKLREDLEQIEATMFRRLQEALVIEVGADKAKELGELPARSRAAMPVIQLGN